MATPHTLARPPGAAIRAPGWAGALARAGRAVSLAGVVLPLALIGAAKFTPAEIAALDPVIRNTPWLAWLYPALGEAGASYLLGVVELATAALLLASPWSPRAGIAGGALASLTFAVTSSIMLALPIWDASPSGLPFMLNGTGQFLVKDVALLGASLSILGAGLAARHARLAPARPPRQGSPD